MIGWLLDTNVVSALINPNGAPSVKAWAAEQDEDDLFLSVLTLGEYDKGIFNLAEDHPDRQRISPRAMHSRHGSREAFDGTMQSDPLVLTARPVIIVEGVYSARRELRDVVDFSVLIEVPEDLRMRRLLEREGQIGPWERQWHLAENWYFENRVGAADFDVVISTDGDGVMEIGPLKRMEQ